MSKDWNFTFIRDYKSYNSCSDARTIVQSDDSDLSAVIEEFERFLRGCGYSFNGSLDIVEDENE